MNFASPFSYVETNEEEEAGVEVLDDSDLEEGVMGEVRLRTVHRRCVLFSGT